MLCTVVGALSASFSPFRFSSLRQKNDVEFWHFPNVPHSIPRETEVLILLFGFPSLTESLAQLHSHSLAIRKAGFQRDLLYYFCSSSGESFLSKRHNDQQLEFYQQALRLIALKFNASIYTGQQEEELFRIISLFSTPLNNRSSSRTVSFDDLLIWAGWDSKKRIAWINEAFGAEELAEQQQQDEIFLECILAKFMQNGESIDAIDKHPSQNWMAKFSAQLETTGGGGAEESTAFSFASTPKMLLSTTKTPQQQTPVSVNSTQKEAISNFFASLMQKTSASRGRSAKS
jgi:hypothetical protein